ncbi:hypothetical protein E4K73_45295 [Streptomyces sp. IB201691-2A2]|nr:hypothetical protein E4K73_45295 [Streptomyces sp. IB201691-2A2]
MIRARRVSRAGRRNARQGEGDPGFCRWFVEPAVYGFGRRLVMKALLSYLRTGIDVSANPYVTGQRVGTAQLHGRVVAGA